jgi:hypothetical protein
MLEENGGREIDFCWRFKHKIRQGKARKKATRFSTIFGEKIGAFLQNQCYDPIFAVL